MRRVPVFAGRVDAGLVTGFTTVGFSGLNRSTSASQANVQALAANKAASKMVLVIVVEFSVSWWKGAANVSAPPTDGC